jgi:cell division protein FtsW
MRASSRTEGPAEAAWTGTAAPLDPHRPGETRSEGDRKQQRAAEERAGHAGAGMPWAYHALWITTAALLVFGLFMVYSSSTADGFFSPSGSSLQYLKDQGMTALVGLAFLVVLSRIDYRRWRRAVPLALLGAFALLVAVHIPNIGHAAKGAVRWIQVGSVSIQPSEVAKFAMVLTSAHLLSTSRALTKGFRQQIMPLLPVAAAVCLLIVTEPDLGTAIVVACVVMGLFWVAEMRFSRWAAVVLGGVAVAGGFILSTAYRRERLLSFLVPSGPLDAARFQVSQALIALASGGLLGVGPGNSIQKFNYLPEAHTDMIFAIIGEEFGLLGVGVVLGLFALFGVAAWRLARRCADPFGRYLIAGFAILICSQAIVNVAGVMGFLPLTGIPLPFVSFGRNNLLVVLLAVGVILAVARYGPVVAPPVRREASGEAEGRDGENLSVRHTQEPVNVTYLDRRRGDGGTRSARPRHS